MLISENFLHRLESLAHIARKKNDSLLLEQIHKDVIEYGYDNFNIFDNKYNKKNLNKKTHPIRDGKQNNDSWNSQLPAYDYDYNENNPPIEFINQALKSLSSQQKIGLKNSGNLIPFYILGPTDKQMGYKNPNHFPNYNKEREVIDEDDEDEETTEDESSDSSDESNSNDEDEDSEEDSEDDDDDNSKKQGGGGRSNKRF